MVLATSRAIVNTMRSDLGSFFTSADAKPSPVTMPMRTHMNWTHPISGHVRTAVQSIDVPSCAPTIEYVATPDGSSSAAPVTKPGPNTEKNLRIRPGCFGTEGASLIGFPSTRTVLLSPPSIITLRLHVCLCVHFPTQDLEVFINEA